MRLVVQEQVLFPSRAICFEYDRRPEPPSRLTYLQFNFPIGQLLSLRCGFDSIAQSEQCFEAVTRERQLQGASEVVVTWLTNRVVQNQRFRRECAERFGHDVLAVEGVVFMTAIYALRGIRRHGLLLHHTNVGSKIGYSSSRQE